MPKNKKFKRSEDGVDTLELVNSDTPKKQKLKIEDVRSGATVTPAPIDPIYELSPMERFNQFPNYSQKLTSSMYANIVLHYQQMGIAKLKEVSKDMSYLSVLEAQVVKGLVRSLSSEADALEHKKYYDDRAFGKPKQTLEHSGPGGSSLHVINEHIQAALDSLTDEELEQLEKMAK